MEYKIFIKERKDEDGILREQVLIIEFWVKGRNLEKEGYARVRTILLLSCTVSDPSILFSSLQRFRYVQTRGEGCGRANRVPIIRIVPGEKLKQIL